MLPTLAHAGPRADGDPWAIGPVELALQAEHDELDLEANDAIVETRIDQIGISLREPLGQHVSGSVRAGYLDLSQDDNPATAGMDLTGGYAGVTLEATPAITDATGLTFGAGYTYHRAEDALEGQETELEWHELRAWSGPRLRLGTIDLSVVAVWHYLDVEEQARGELTRDRSLEAADAVGGRLGMDWHLRPGGRIGLELEAGARQALQLEFAQWF